EEDVARLQRRQDRGDVALALEGRPCDLPDADTELVADDLRERGLAEPGRAGEEEMVERLAARFRRLERDRELLLHALLADEVGQVARTERALELVFLVLEDRREKLAGHAARRSTARTCSSTDSSWSTSASARSASSSDHPSPTSASRATSSSLASVE